MSTLYVIGVGPGDPELLTLKAVRLIREMPVIFVPKGREDGTSLALSIIKSIVKLDRKKIIELHFPMIKTAGTNALSDKWSNLAQEMIQNLRDADGAFLTLGDPCFYSTFFYLYDRLLRLSSSLRIEIIPGVSSINASAARAGIPLGLAGDRIAIIPANYIGKLMAEETLDHELQIWSAFDTIVFMKVDRNFYEIKKFLMDKGLINRSIYLSRVGMRDERVIHDLNKVKEQDLDYFSMVIVRNKRNG